MPLGTRVGLGQGHIVLNGDPALPTERGTAAAHFSAHVYCGETDAHLSQLLSFCRKAYGREFLDFTMCVKTQLTRD